MYLFRAKTLYFNEKYTAMQTTINERIQMIIDQFFSSNSTKLANRANIPLSTISSIVGKRKNVPSYMNLSKIYEVTYKLGVSAHWLLTGEGDMIDDDQISRFTEVNHNTINRTFAFFNNAGKLSPEGKDSYIRYLEEERKQLKGEIKQTKIELSQREKFITTLLSNMNDNLTDKE